MADPVWMYRKGEAKLFASPAEVTAGEGWQDSPVAADAVAAEPETEAPQDDTPEHLEHTALRERAAALGIKVDGRWSSKKIARMIEEAESTDE